MIQIRKSEERRHAQHGWLDSYHTFSFADYYDPKNVAFRSLRVINEDRVAPSRGFGEHGHADMEILTYVISGSLAHKDSMGHQEALGPNEIQRMSAGTGIRHSEFNASATQPVHFFQIWIQPAIKGLKPSYEQIAFAADEKRDKWKPLAGPQGYQGVAQINQDVHVFVTELTASHQLQYKLDPKRYAWVHVIKGNVTLNGSGLAPGDSAALSQEPGVELTATGIEPSEVLLFDLA